MIRKLMSLAVIIACAVLVNITGFATNTGDYGAFQDSLGREFVLATTFDPDRMAQFVAEGEVIHASGSYKDAEVVDFYISGVELNNPRHEIISSIGADGVCTFNAYYGGVPKAAAPTHARAVLKFADGVTMSYRVEYNPNVGWFFGDNGISEKGMEVIGNYHVIPPEISAYYISATLDPDEINETRDKLYEIVAEVTFGIDDDYQKAKALNQWVADNFYYDYDARENEVTEETVSVYNTLRLQRSVCIGLGNLYSSLLEAAGIKAVNIKGGIASNAEGFPYETLTERGAPHEWVAFWYDAESRWVYADPTWDRRGIYEHGEYLPKPPIMKHFDISPLALSFDHRGDRAELRNYFGEFLLPDNEEEIAAEVAADEPPEFTVQVEEPLILPEEELEEVFYDDEVIHDNATPDAVIHLPETQSASMTVFLGVSASMIFGVAVLVLLAAILVVIILKKRK